MEYGKIEFHNNVMFENTQIDALVWAHISTMAKFHVKPGKAPRRPLERKLAKLLDKLKRTAKGKAFMDDVSKISTEEK